MTDIQELKRLAEVANKPMSQHGSLMAKQDAYFDFQRGANPSTILSLIERIEALDHALRFARGMVAYSASGYTHSGDMTNRAVKALEVIDAVIAAKSTKEQG